MHGFIKAFAMLVFTSATGFILAPSAYANAPYCREFTKEVLIGGQMQQSYGTACLQPDGSWQVMNADGTLSPQTVIIHDRQVVSPPTVVVQRQPSFYFGLNTGNYHYGSHRSHFYRHHHGPGAHHHWKHHRKVLHPHHHKHHRKHHHR